MTKTKLIGCAALVVCALGYGGMAAVLLAAKADMIAPTMAVLLAAVAALIGEGGLWVGAGCLGLTLFKKRKAMIDRLLARRRSAVPQA